MNAQNLGPFRQFLALEGSYTRLQLDGGDGEDMIGLNGYSAHVWINAAESRQLPQPGDEVEFALHL